MSEVTRLDGELHIANLDHPAARDRHLGEPGDPAGGWFLTLLQRSGTPRLDLSDQPVKS
jgi:hypothetical protein